MKKIGFFCFFMKICYTFGRRFGNKRKKPANIIELEELLTLIYRKL